MTDDIAARARRRTGTIILAVVAALLVGVAATAGVVVALGHRHASVSQPPSQNPAGPAPMDAATPSASPGTASSGPDLVWATVAGAKVPVSRTAGPRDVTGGRARGFARSPLGAVLAAAHISLRLSPQAGPAVFEPTLREQVVGADVEALRRHLDDDYQSARAQLGVAYGAPAGQLYSTARGYRVTSGADSADVELLIEGPAPSSGSVLIALSLHLRWVSGDWALVAPAGGVWDDAAVITTDSTGYTPFPPSGG